MEEEVITNQKIAGSSLIIEKIDWIRKTISPITYQGFVKLELHRDIVKDRERNNDAHQNAYLLQRTHQLV